MTALQEGEPGPALEALERLQRSCPDEPAYCDHLATYAERAGCPERGSAAYERFLRQYPGEATTRFNHARLLRARGLQREALAQYRQCLADGIDGAEEVHTNIGAILSDLHCHGEAEEAFRAALALQAAYLPALYNLALLREEQGDWPAAKALYRQVLQAEPGHAEAAVRLVQGQRLESVAAPELATLERLLAEPGVEDTARESLFYGLGKGLDDCAEYARAFAAYREANRLSRRRCGDYDREAEERLTGQLLAAPVLAELSAVSQRPLVFICGMFRSGSTLLEQMLAGHPALQAGGEIPLLASRAQLPQWLAAGAADHWRQLAHDYLAYLDQTFTGDAVVLDKRPDNLRFLGLLLRLFPAARVLHTVRQPLDNCLSVWFQQLGSDFRYANALPDVAHYLRCQQRLLAGWEADYGDRLHGVAYESLVQSPRQTLADALDFLGLPWHEDCLSFSGRDTRVRTASVAQVRQSLYGHAVDRWRNYAAQLAELAPLFPA